MMEAVILLIACVGFASLGWTYGATVLGVVLGWYIWCDYIEYRDSDDSP